MQKPTFGVPTTRSSTTIPPQRAFTAYLHNRDCQTQLSETQGATFFVSRVGGTLVLRYVLVQVELTS